MSKSTPPPPETAAAEDYSAPHQVRQDTGENVEQDPPPSAAPDNRESAPQVRHERRAPSETEGPPPRIGLVLGAGAARGWAHIGALEALQALGVRPSVIVGCSSGAIAAAAYAADRLPALRAFAESLTWRGVLGYFDVSWRGGGLIEGRWLSDALRDTVGERDIETLPLRYGAVATELGTGRETWFTSGSLVDSVRASIALPGLMSPIAVGGRWMVDGALVNPMPVSLCRALGADIILGVSMSGDLVTLGRSPLAIPAVEDPNGPLGKAVAPPIPDAPRASWRSWLAGGAGWSAYWADVQTGARPPMPRGRPGYFDVIGQSFFTVQNFVTRVRLAADPVDVLAVPDVASIGIMDFHRAADAIAAGRAAIADRAEIIQALCRPSGARSR